MYWIQTRKRVEKPRKENQYQIEVLKGMHHCRIILIRLLMDKVNFKLQVQLYQLNRISIILQ